MVNDLLEPATAIVFPLAINGFCPIFYLFYFVFIKENGETMGNYYRAAG